MKVLDIITSKTAKVSGFIGLVTTMSVFYTNVEKDIESVRYISSKRSEIDSLIKHKNDPLEWYTALRLEQGSIRKDMDTVDFNIGYLMDLSGVFAEMATRKKKIDGVWFYVAVNGNKYYKSEKDGLFYHAFLDHADSTYIYFDFNGKQRDCQ